MDICGSRFIFGFVRFFFDFFFVVHFECLSLKINWLRRRIQAVKTTKRKIYVFLPVRFPFLIQYFFLEFFSPVNNRINSDIRIISINWNISHINKDKSSSFWSIHNMLFRHLNRKIGINTRTWQYRPYYDVQTVEKRFNDKICNFEEQM